MVESEHSTSTPEENAAGSPSVTPVFGSLVSGVMATFATRVMMLAGVAGASVIVGRWLGPEGVGALAVINVTGALALQFGSAGLPSAMTYFIARDRAVFAPAWGNAIVCALGGGTAIAGIVVGLAYFKPVLFGGVPARLIAIMAISIPCQLLTLLGLNLLL